MGGGVSVSVLVAVRLLPNVPRSFLACGSMGCVWMGVWERVGTQLSGCAEGLNRGSPAVLEAFERVGYRGYLTFEYFNPYPHWPEAIAYHTSDALDRMLSLPADRGWRGRQDGVRSGWCL